MEIAGDHHGFCDHEDCGMVLGVMAGDESLDRVGFLTGLTHGQAVTFGDYHDAKPGWAHPGIHVGDTASFVTHVLKQGSPLPQ